MYSGKASLTIDQVIEQVEQLRGAVFPNELSVSGPHSYDVIKEAEQGFNRELDGARNNGIYIYTTQEGDVLYIGKGEYKSGHGIGYRSFAHLGRTCSGKDGHFFPYHQWSDDDSVEPDLANLISEGKFIIWTFPVTPDYFSSLVEVHLLSAHKHLVHELPPLNKKI